MRDTINHHSRPATGMSLPTSTHSDTTKSRHWVTTTRLPVVETTPPTQAPSGRVVRYLVEQGKRVGIGGCSLIGAAGDANAAVLAGPGSRHSPLGE